MHPTRQMARDLPPTLPPSGGQGSGGKRGGGEVGHGGPPLPGRASARSDVAARRGGNEGGTTACSARAIDDERERRVRSAGGPLGASGRDITVRRARLDPGRMSAVRMRAMCVYDMCCVCDCDCLTAADPNVLPRALVRPTGMRFRTRPRSQRGLRSDIQKNGPRAEAVSSDKIRRFTVPVFIDVEVDAILCSRCPPMVNALLFGSVSHAR